MEIKMFYRTQRELAEAINHIIDSYWSHDKDDKEMIDNIIQLYENNTKKIIKDDDFTTILKQQCGKRRLEVVGRVIEMNGKV